MIDDELHVGEVYARDGASTLPTGSSSSLTDCNFPETSTLRNEAREPRNDGFTYRPHQLKETTQPCSTASPLSNVQTYPHDGAKIIPPPPYTVLNDSSVLPCKAEPRDNGFDTLADWEKGLGGKPKDGQLRSQRQSVQKSTPIPHRSHEETQESSASISAYAADSISSVQELYRTMTKHEENVKRLRERTTKNQQDIGRLLLQAAQCKEAARQRIQIIKRDEVTASAEQALYEQARHQLQSIMQ